MRIEMPTPKEIFWKMLDLNSAAEREQQLDKDCGTDAVLRARVEQLLAAQQCSDSFLDIPQLSSSADVPPITDASGTEIGPYRLREQIGEGGMGIVYVAEQTEPVRRKVALKLIKPGMDTRQVIARFEAERQALALMDHPNIAKVLDAGATDAGRPYFVMDLVSGTPITEYCDQAMISTTERLCLFIKVCKAIQHAHQKGIIHRDIKPSNVLITMMEDGPEPKVIDFGIAKAIDRQLTQQTLYTAHDEMIGTPLYMSPEQAEKVGFDVDTRSDVYSLGVLLYELLTGLTPFDKQTLKQAGIDEVRRMIREDEPQRPSARISTLKAEQLSTISDQRGVDPRKYSHALSGELDWIVMQALEKDRNRRYESAAAFAADIGRYLNDEQVDACPPSTAYRLRKYVRRNKAALITAIVVFSSLIAATAVSTGFAIRTNRALSAEQDALDHALQAEKASSRRAIVSRAVNDFLQNDLLFQARGHQEDVNRVRLNSMLDHAAAHFEENPSDDLLINAAIHMTIGNTYLVLARFNPDGDSHWDRALQIRQTLPEEDRKTLDEMFPRIRPSAPTAAIFGPDFDGNGHSDLYVASVTHEILVYDGDTGKDLGVFVSTRSGGLDYPFHLTFGPNEELYVCSNVTNEILQYDGKTGEFQTAFVTAGDGGLDHPTDLTFGPDVNMDGNADLFVASGRSNEILAYDGVSGASLGPLFPANTTILDNPTKLAFGPDGTLYIGGRFTNNVARYDFATGHLTVFVESFSAAPPATLALAFGPDGNLFIGSGAKHEVLRFQGPGGDTPGMPMPAVGNERAVFVTSRSGELNGPTDLVFKADGSLLVCSRYSHRILNYEGPAGQKPGRFIATLIAARHRNTDLRGDSE